MLDVYELCTPELQDKMESVRSKFKEVEDKKLEKQQQKVRFHTLATPLYVYLYHNLGFSLFLLRRSTRSWRIQKK